MRKGQMIEHAPSGIRGTFIYRDTVKNKIRVRVENGRDRIFPASECKVARLVKPQVEPSLLSLSRKCGRAPDDILHLAKMVGLTPKQVAEAIVQ